MTDTPEQPPPEDDNAADDAAAAQDATESVSEQTAEESAESASQDATEPAPAQPPTIHADPPSGSAASIDSLPPYSRSLLKVKVPVVVTLASRKESISNITEIGPGTIIQFEKACEDPLQLEAGGQPLAHGEAVKVGDKFGLRILSMLLPNERFRSVGGRPEKSMPS